MKAEATGWRVAREPEQDASGDWTVVFRMDDGAPGEEGPQITVTGSALVADRDPDDEDEDWVEDVNEREGYGLFGNTVYLEYEVWGANGECACCLPRSGDGGTFRRPLPAFGPG